MRIRFPLKSAGGSTSSGTFDWSKGSTFGGSCDERGERDEQRIERRGIASWCVRLPRGGVVFGGVCLPGKENTPPGSNASGVFDCIAQVDLAHWYGPARTVSCQSRSCLTLRHRLDKGMTRDDSRWRSSRKPPRKSRRPSRRSSTAPRSRTSRPTAQTRDAVRAAVESFCKTVDKSKPLTKESTREMARGVLKSLGLGEQYLGFTMVMLTNEFWREQVAAIPFNRRLMLLPHCLKNAEGCPADYDEFGLDCQKCGACSSPTSRTQGRGTRLQGARLRRHADRPEDHRLRPRRRHRRRRLPERAGEGVRQDPARRHPVRRDAAAVEQLQEHVGRRRLGVRVDRPAHAAAGDEDEDLRAPDAGGERAVRGAGADAGSCPPARAAAIAASQRPARAGTSRSPTTSSARGGKRSRPFITLAAYDALKGAPATLAETGWELPDAGQARRRRHRDVPQGVARPRRHRGRRRLPLRPGDAAPRARRRHRDQRRRLPDRPRLPARRPRPQGARRGGRGRHPRQARRRAPEAVARARGPSCSGATPRTRR